MSLSTVLISLAILASVLVADLGHKRITASRIARPLIALAVVVPAFVSTPATGGLDLVLELAATALGALLGAAAARLQRVGRDGASGALFTDAGAGYAAVWVAVTALRLGAGWAISNVFTGEVGHWMFANHVSGAAITDAFLGFSIAAVVARTVSIGIRALRPAQPAAAATAVVAGVAS